MEKKVEEKKISFEFFEKELERVLTELESGKIDSLDKLLENYEYGMEMVKKCEQILKEAEMRVMGIRNG